MVNNTITSSTHPTTTLTAASYTITVGFEVNVPNALVEKKYSIFSKEKKLTQILDIDYGHAYFYVSKNDVVEAFFSFGPSQLGKVGWFNQGRTYPIANTGAVVKGGYANSRQGTPDYPIGEKSHLYRMTVKSETGKKIVDETNKIRQEIISGDQKYTAWVNDTCAETAYDILEKFISNLPEGSGHVQQSSITPSFTVINPYMWHHNFKKSKFSKPEIVYPREGFKDGGRLLRTVWTLKPQDKDPLVAEGYL